jgi:NDP-sugar pyrophosphorylase family protein
MSPLAGWPALVLAAGLGTRLRPLSAARAKAALPVAGETLVCRILRRLRAAGIERAVLNLHHRPETITREVGDGAQFGMTIRYSWESALQGSAGGPARALPLLEADRFLIVNGDTLTDVDLADVASRHLATGALVTMAVVAGDPRYGGVAVNQDGVVIGFVPSSTLSTFSTWHFVGVQAVNASAFAGVDPDHPSETVKALYPRLIAKRPESVRAYASHAEFLDIGTPRGYLETAVRIAAREGKPLDRGRRCLVSPDAHLEGTILWDDIVIEADASLTNCIVTDGVTVPVGAQYQHCSLVATNGEMIAVPFEQPR